jgi:hypothetical protein
LHVAVLMDHIHVREYLLQQDASLLHEPNLKFKTPLMMMAKRRIDQIMNYEFIPSLYNIVKLQCTEKAKCCKNLIRLFKMAKSSGSRLCFENIPKDEETKMDFVSFLVENGHFEALEKLLPRDFQDDGPVSLVWRAASSNQVGVLEILLEKRHIRKHWRRRGPDSTNALEVAFCKKHYGIIEAFRDSDLIDLHVMIDLMIKFRLEQQLNDLLRRRSSSIHNPEMVRDKLQKSLEREQKLKESGSSFLIETFSKQFPLMKEISKTFKSPSTRCKFLDNLEILKSIIF